MKLLDLDEHTGKLMVEEINLDITAGNLYVSDRLTPAGAEQWPDLLLSSAESADIGWLIEQISRPGILERQVQRKTKAGTGTAKMPSNASQTLAEGKFNRYYIRGVCRRAIDAGQNVYVYRAKNVNKPRPQSESLVGTALDPAKLLKDLRENPGVETAIGLPSGPNSGLTAGLKPYGRSGNQAGCPVL